MRHVSALTLGLMALGSATSMAGGQEYQIIVNSSRNIQQIHRSELAEFFLKRASKWSDGVPVAPVDLTMVSEVRRSFTQEVLANSVNAILAYWEQQIFSGRKQPPPVKQSETDVIAFVLANPGAIGYVSGRIPLPPGVTPVSLIAAEKRASGAAQ